MELVNDCFFETQKFLDHLELNIKNMTILMKQIEALKERNLAEIKQLKNSDEFYYHLHLRKIYDDNLERLKESLNSASMYLNYVKLFNISNDKGKKIDNETEKLRKTILTYSYSFLCCSRRFSRLSIIQAFSEEQSDNTMFAVYLLEKFDLDKEEHERNLWNIAIGDYNETCFILLPKELLRIKWLCNQVTDDISTFSNELKAYSLLNINSKRLLINLCFTAYKFFECCNYKCSLYIVDTLLNILKENKTDSKEKYYHFYLCKGLLMMKLDNEREGMKIFMEGIKYLRNKLGSEAEKDIFIAVSYMCVGCIFVDNDFSELGSTILEMSVQCFEQYLPHSYELWIETTDMLARCYNNSFNFISSLITVAPVYDYFHILNFGSIKAENRPVYELAMSIPLKGSLLSISKQLKYASYIPNNISLLLKEMMVSFSGLGDKTSVNVIKNWIDRCKNLSQGKMKLIIESCDYFGEIDMEKVVNKMKKNKSRHKELFVNRSNTGIDESSDISSVR